MRRRLTRSVVLAPALAMVLVLTGMGAAVAAPAHAAASGPTTTTVPAPKTTHPGVNRVLVISLPTISWEDLDLERLPNLRRLFEQSAVADLIVRGVVRLPTLSDGYLTIGAGSRSVGVSRTDSKCLEMTEPFGETTARDELARRNGVPASTIPRSAIGCFDQRQIVAKNNSMLFDAEVGLLGGSLQAAGIQRAAIGNGDTTLTPSDSPDSIDYQRYAPLALADANGIVPEGKVDSSLLERDPTAPFGVRLDPDRVLAAFDRTWKAQSSRRAVVLVEASDLLRMRAVRAVPRRECARSRCSDAC